MSMAYSVLYQVCVSLRRYYDASFNGHKEGEMDSELYLSKNAPQKVRKGISNSFQAGKAVARDSFLTRPLLVLGVLLN